MFTVCPKCTLTLAVTANDLRLGQGYVRCGRCSNVFNALLKLSDAPGDGATGADVPELAQADPASHSQIRRAITAAAAEGAVSATPPASAAANAPASATAASPAISAGAPLTPRPPASAPPASGAPSATAQAPARPATNPPAAAPPPSAPPDARRSAAQPAAAPKPAPAPTPAPAPAAAPMAAAARSAPPQATDADAIDHFELVLKTLGLNEDDDESALRLSPDSESSQTIESIVLEGDEVTQSQSRIPDKPLDELDLFTRRLSMAASAPAPAATRRAAAPGAGADSPTEAVASAPPAGRLGRARLRREVTRPAPGPVGDASTAAARVAGRDVGTTDDEQPLAIVSEVADLNVPGFAADSPNQRRLWLGGAIALGVLLLGQFVNHWRDALAASPTWGGPVKNLYAALGVALQPHWDLSAYEVRQQGAESDSAANGAIRVRFSLANHAVRAQPVPLLRLTLLDRYGRKVAERDLTPADYWPQGRSPQSFLAADERVDTEVQVRDPSADSASFELDVCLRDAQGAVRCAADAAAPTVSS